MDLWLYKGDKKTNLFHQYANHYNINKILNIKNPKGEEVKNFKDIAKATMTQFGKIFKENE